MMRNSCHLFSPMSIALGLPALVLAVAPATAYGSNFGAGIFPGCPYSTLQQAVNNANPGDTVWIQPGPWHGEGTVVVDRNLTFVPADTNCGGPDLNNQAGLEPACILNCGDPILEILPGVEVTVNNVDFRYGRNESQFGGTGVGGSIVMHEGSKLWLKNSAFYGGRADKGGAIAAAGPNVRVYVEEGVSFDDTRANQQGGAVYLTAGSQMIVYNGGWIGGTDAPEGGVVYLHAPSSTLSLAADSGISVGAAIHGGCVGGNGTVSLWSDSEIWNCSAREGGAIKADAVYMNQQARIHTAEADHNGLGRGGAVYARVLEMNDFSEIHGTSAVDKGGAVYVTESISMLDFSVIHATEAGGAGGAIYSEGSVLLDFVPEIHDAVAGGAGGAIYAEGSVTQTGWPWIFTTSAGTDGGAIHAASVSMTGASDIRWTTAGGDGGAIFIQDGGSLWISDAAKVRDAEAGGNGGLVATGAGVTAIIADDVELHDGVAGADGGLVYLGGGSSLTVGNSGTGTFKDTTLRDGSAVGNGGAIYASAASVGTTQVTLQGDARVLSSSAVYGGGLYLASSELALYDHAAIGSLDQGNTARFDGGGIYAADSAIMVAGGELDYKLYFDETEKGARVDRNQAGRRGGGIALAEASTLSGTRLVVYGNRATGLTGVGGGLSVVGEAWAELDYAVIQDNEAKRGGGAFVDSGTLLMEGKPTEACWPGATMLYHVPEDRYCTEILGNTSVGGGKVSSIGGAIYSKDATVELRAVGIQNNHAALEATALFFDGGTSALTDNVLVAAPGIEVPVSVVVANRAAMNTRMSTFADLGTTVVYRLGSSGIMNGDIVWPMGGAGSGLVVQSSLVTGNCNVGLGVSALGANNTNADPSFVTTVRGKYRINSASPAYNYCANGPNYDLDGTSRVGATKDAGTFEVP